MINYLLNSKAASIRSGFISLLLFKLFHNSHISGADQPQKLYDYGFKGEHHLELRKGFPYHGVMPDLNGHRYLSYTRAYELSELTGENLPYLSERAAALKTLMKNELWSEKDKWFYFNNGKKQLRWTNIMFMLINSPVLDKEERDGLISHLNEKEFLGEYGIHSMSKLDSAYDQVDIDHGGGSDVSFPPIIAQKLYNEENISLKGLKIRGYNIDITADMNDFIVNANGQTYYSKIGTR